VFPAFHQRFEWAKHHRRLEAAECRGIVQRLRDLLVTRYLIPLDGLTHPEDCSRCGYPAVFSDQGAPAAIANLCSECRRSS
jgi:hypothetical protein